MNKHTELEYHDKDAAIEPPRRKPFPKQAQEGDIASVEMTKSCARELTDRIKAGVNDIAELLHRAHEGRAWAALGYASWKDYCAVEFQMSKQRSFQLLDFVEIKQTLQKSTTVDSLPTSERQTRALKQLEPEQQVAAWNRAVEIAGGEQPSAKQVERAVVKKVLSRDAKAWCSRTLISLPLPRTL